METYSFEQYQESAEALRARLSGQPDSVEEVTEGIVTLLTRNEETL